MQLFNFLRFKKLSINCIYNLVLTTRFIFTQFFIFSFKVIRFHTAGLWLSGWCCVLLLLLRTLDNVHKCSLSVGCCEDIFHIYQETLSNLGQAKGDSNRCEFGLEEIDVMEGAWETLQLLSLYCQRWISNRNSGENMGDDLKYLCGSFTS